MGTRGQWAIDFLNALGNNAPTDDTVKLVAAWTKAEGTKAEFNPLATTYTAANSTDFNSVGVKNYATRADGINASVATLSENFPGYPELKAALIKNNVAEAFTSGGFDTWGTHNGNVLINYNDGDHRDELLMSDSTGGATLIEKKVKSGELHPTIEQPSPIPNISLPSVNTPQVSESDVRNVAKGALGLFLIFTGIVVFIIMIAQSQPVQDVAATAVKVAAV